MKTLKTIWQSILLFLLFILCLVCIGTGLFLIDLIGWFTSGKTPILKYITFLFLDIIFWKTEIGK